MSWPEQTLFLQTLHRIELGKKLSYVSRRKRSDWIQPAVCHYQRQSMQLLVGIICWNLQMPKKCHRITIFPNVKVVNFQLALLTFLHLKG